MFTDDEHQPLCKRDGAAIMVQFECSKCGHVMDRWSSGSRQRTYCEVENGVKFKQGKRTRQVNHDLHIAAIATGIGPQDFHRMQAGMGIPHVAKRDAFARATKLV